MIRKKIYFVVFTLFFLFVMIIFSLAYNIDVGLPKKNIILIDQKENPNKNFSCFPVVPASPTVILRIDDIGANNYKNARFKLADEILSRNFSVVLGVIPNKINYDIELKKYVKNNINNPRFEVAQHGYMHTSEEFKTLNEEDAYENLKNGQNLIYKTFEFYPLTFIPPENLYSSGTIEAMKKLNFKIISSGQDEYKFDGSLSYFGKNSQTYDFGTSSFTSSENVLNKCKESLRLRNVCVIMIHPQDYLDEKKRIDEWKFNEFLKMLDGLEKMEVESSTFKDLIYCK